MGLGVLEATKVTHVQGTTVLDETANELSPDAALAGLKMGTGKDSHIVLVPQPSDDPNDPLVSYIPHQLRLSPDGSRTGHNGRR
jgi:hypothetical protein